MKFTLRTQTQHLKLQHTDGQCEIIKYTRLLNSISNSDGVMISECLFLAFSYTLRHNISRDRLQFFFFFGKKRQNMRFFSFTPIS